MKKIIFLAALAMTAMGMSATTPIVVSEQTPVVSENFNSMWDASTSEALMTLPDGWAIDRNLDAPRTIGSWSEASNEVMYTGGASLASNAKNGTWNFGATADSSDRAIGGLTTTVANGTRCVSLMTGITNESDRPIDRFTLSYDIEKYRKGANAAGFAVQVYYSHDGEAWISAGESFQTVFEPDSETIGAEVVPIATTNIVNKQMLVDVAPGETVYLAWNISVASGSTPDKAPGLAIDNISVAAEFASENSKFIFVENALKASKVTLFSTPTDFFGEAGSTTSLSKIVNGVEYMVWNMPSVAELELTAVAGGQSYGPLSVSTASDCYMCLSRDGLTLIEDPLTYNGWVDPDRAPFVSSGIYIRGEVNSWGAVEEWEFSNEGNNTYVLYDKKLSGQFKVADSGWTSACNYGSNGSNISVDTPYQLQKGVDDNISCGSYVFDCKRIVLSITDSSAMLLLEANDDDSGLTSVYVYGDFNNWDFMATNGELKLDESDNLFKGQISMKAGADGLSHWRIYQRQGMGGAWGLDQDADQSALSGTLTKGSTGNAAVKPATYEFEFSLTDGSYTLTEVESSPTQMVLAPLTSIITPENPEKIKVLSLNNSLIHYNDQDFVFNDIARAMNVEAGWTKHTNLGKPLSYHWDEGDGLAEDGTPGAKMMIRSDVWSHIILQEQSSLPRTNPETFRNNVAKWIEYIREYCPNPNAVIIIPVNWAYSSDLDNFNAYNNRFVEVYGEVAQELGAMVVPVAVAYDNAYTKEGKDELGTWFSDDRHPTLKATYMAACMEFGAITGIDPATISFTPSGITAAEGEKMRVYASEALNSYDNVINHLNGTVKFSTRIFDDYGIEYAAEDVKYEVEEGGSISADGVFKSDGTRGTFTVKVKCGDFAKEATVTVADHATEYITYPSITLNSDNLSATEDFNSMGQAAEAKLPEAWRIDRQTQGPRTLGTYATASEATTYAGGTSLPANAKNGVWNFGADQSDDRAPGGITTGVDNGTRAINLYTHLSNDGRKPLAKVNVAYDIIAVR